MLSDFAKFAALTLEQNETDQLSFCALDKSTGEVKTKLLKLVLCCNYARQFLNNCVTACLN